MATKTKTSRSKKLKTPDVPQAPVPEVVAESAPPKDGVRWEFRKGMHGVIRITSGGEESWYFCTVVAYRTFKFYGEKIAVVKLEKMVPGGNAYHVVVGNKGQACPCPSKTECKHIKAVRALLESDLL